MQQNHPGSKFIGEVNCVLETFPRTIGKIDRHKNCMSRRRPPGFRFSLSCGAPQTPDKASAEQLVLPCFQGRRASVRYAVRWHDDQVGRNLLRESADFIERRCAT